MSRHRESRPKVFAALDMLEARPLDMEARRDLVAEVVALLKIHWRAFSLAPQNGQTFKKALGEEKAKALVLPDEVATPIMVAGDERMASDLQRITIDYKPDTENPRLLLHDLLVLNTAYYFCEQRPSSPTLINQLDLALLKAVKAAMYQPSVLGNRDGSRRLAKGRTLKSANLKEAILKLCPSREVIAKKNNSEVARIVKRKLINSFGLDANERTIIDHLKDAGKLNRSLNHSIK